VQTLLQAAQALGWQTPPPLAIVIATAPTLIFLAALWWIVSRQRASRRPATAGRAVAAVFGAVGIANLALVAVIGSVAWREHSLTTWLIYPCAIFVLQGAAWMVVYVMKRRAWHLAVAAGWIAAAIAMALTVADLAVYTLIGAAALWTCMAAPGFALIRGADHARPQ
jgi:hypothetical protein